MNTENKKKTPARRPEDGRVLAVENEEQVLLAIHRFGWLPTRQIHAYIWPKSASPRMAQRTMERLREAGQVVFKRGKDGSTVYALSAAGARRVKQVFGHEASTGKDLARRIERNFEHRCVANEVCIWWAHADFEGAGTFNTENEIAHGLAPISKKRAHFGKKEGKIPDALVYMKPPVDAEANPHKDDWWVGWVEAEAGHKNLPKQMHMVGEIAYMLGFGGTEYEERRFNHLGKLEQYRIKFAVVACPKVSHEERLAKSMLDFLWAKNRWQSYAPDKILKNVFVLRPDGSLTTLAHKITTEPALIYYEAQCRKHA